MTGLPLVLPLQRPADAAAWVIRAIDGLGCQLAVVWFGQDGQLTGCACMPKANCETQLWFFTTRTGWLTMLYCYSYV